METIRFSSKEHKDFYSQMLIKTRNDDSYHRAFFYAMGICEETRRNIHTYYLVQWCYRQLGVSLPRTASAQAEYCENNGLTISPNDLEPGDLVFWSFENNDRFMNISHVGIYAGDGKVVDASSSRGQVVYHNLFDMDKQVLYGRVAR